MARRRAKKKSRVSRRASNKARSRYLRKETAGQYAARMKAEEELNRRLMSMTHEQRVKAIQAHERKQDKLFKGNPQVEPAFVRAEREEMASMLERAGVKQPSMWATKYQREGVGAYELAFRLETGTLKGVRKNPGRAQHCHFCPNPGRPSYADLHGGLEGDWDKRRMAAPKVTGTMTYFAPLYGIVYGPIDKGDGKDVYEHAFTGSKPQVVINEAGDLVILRGGSKYKVEPRGIVG